MDFPKLEVAAWNLTLTVGAVALGGCGPKVPGGEGSTDSVGSEESNDEHVITDESITDPTQPATSTMPPECRSAADCPLYHDCIDGRCIYYCLDGCCDGGLDGCWYYECYSHGECADGEVCRYNDCEPAEVVPGCDALLGSLANIPLPPDFDTEPLQIAFVNVDLDGGEELIVGGIGGGQILHVGTDNPSIPLSWEGEAREIAGADIDGDGDGDLLVRTSSDSGYFTLYEGDGNGNFMVSATEIFGTGIVLGNLDSEGWLDAVVVEDGVRLAMLGMSEQEPPTWTELEWTPDASSAIGSLDGMAPDEIVGTYFDRVAIWYGPPTTVADDTVWDATQDNPTAVAVADLDGDGIADIVSTEPVDGYSILSVMRGEPGGVFQPAQHVFLEREFTTIEAGQLDGDGRGDLLLRGPADLAIVLGGNDFGAVSCASTVFDVGTQFVLGDIDADGRDEIGILDGVTVGVWRAP